MKWTSVLKWRFGKGSGVFLLDCLIIAGGAMDGISSKVLLALTKLACMTGDKLSCSSRK